MLLDAAYTCPSASLSGLHNYYGEEFWLDGYDWEDDAASKGRTVLISSYALFGLPLPSSLLNCSMEWQSAAKSLPVQADVSPRPTTDYCLLSISY